ncbi:MAG: hypothetical protein Q7J80_06485, partial [Anaerolineales bacterium]|nr:hypothetical protein [Anaerolineales bacterium]
IGLRPTHMMRNAFNPGALEAAFARPANAVFAPYRAKNGRLIFPRAKDGSIMMKDRFGYLGGYAVPLPDELRAKAGAIYPGGMQLITQPLWHVQTYTSASTTSLSFFNANLTEVTGNLEQAGTVGFPKSFILRAPRFMLNTFASTTAGGIPAVWNDNALLVLNSYNYLQVVDKISFRIPTWMVPAGAGVAGAAAGTFTAEEVVAIGQNGIASPKHVYVLLDPIWFEPQVSFQYRVTWSAAQTLTGSNQSVTVMLDGQVIRPIQ